MSAATWDFKVGGKLIHNKWIPPTNWDDKSDNYKTPGYYEPIDMTENENWLYKRNGNIILEDGFTLNDLFKFLSKQSDLLDIIFPNCYISDYVKHWKQIDQAMLLKLLYGKDEIEYLELYWLPEISFDWDYSQNKKTSGTKLIGASESYFHGVGFALKEDHYEEHYDKPIWKTGDRISWGIDFTPLEKLLLLPIKLNEEFIVQEDFKEFIKANPNASHLERKTLINTKQEFTLEEVIRSVMYELSFYGPEEIKLEKRKEVLDSVEKAKNANSN